jgi:hypothetical protein
MWADSKSEHWRSIQLNRKSLDAGTPGIPVGYRGAGCRNSCHLHPVAIRAAIHSFARLSGNQFLPGHPGRQTLLSTSFLDKNSPPSCWGVEFLYVGNCRRELSALFSEPTSPLRNNAPLETSGANPANRAVFRIKKGAASYDSPIMSGQVR